MFKKTKIAAVSAVVLGLSSMTAQAVAVNEAGSQGEVLIFPYYNVNSGFVTKFNITNTTDAYKAIKVRFRESGKSNDVLDFNLYMSPRDVFTMDLRKGSDDGVVLTTVDSTCTQPMIPAGGVLFRHNAYNSTDVEDVRQGYLEIIEMGEVSRSATVFNKKFRNSRQLIASQGLLHGADGVPADCTVIPRAWAEGTFVQGGAASNTNLYDIVNPDVPGFPVQHALTSDDGYYGQSRASGLTQPQGGLVGTSILLDTVNIAGYVAEPASITNYSTVSQHYLSSDENFYLLPSLASGSVSTAEYLIDFDSNGDGRADTVKAAIQQYSYVERDWGLDDPNSAPRRSVPSGINPMPMADALLVNSVANAFFLGGDTTHTDWVIATPMRKHAIYNNYQYVPSASGYTKGADIAVAGAKDATNGYWAKLNANDVNAPFGYWDREEQPNTEITADDFSPPNVTVDDDAIFGREVNVFTLTKGNGAESVLGASNSVALDLQEGFENGWGGFSFAGYNLASSRYTAWVGAVNRDIPSTGVPVIGFMAARGVLGGGQVGETFPHIYVRSSDTVFTTGD